VEVCLSIDALVVVMGVGAFLIAIWVDSRFPRLSPKTLASALLHLFAAMAAGNVLVPLAVGAGADNPSRLVAGVFAVGLPVLVYLFLAGVWLIKYGQRMLGGSVR
jgi:hypothetical protein